MFLRTYPMSRRNHNYRTVMGVKTEFLTALQYGAKARLEHSNAVAELLAEHASLSPSLPGPSGTFNGYGRLYADGMHVETATAECSDPFGLVAMQERQELLLASATFRLHDRGIELMLSNCNHSGLLTDDAPTWGSHGNYLVASPPETLADRMLPFLATRVYAGAGGVHWPSGTYSAVTRNHFLETERGGATTLPRALYSTARDEPLTRDPLRYGYRYHTILDDGLRSQFGRLLRSGATALALAAVQHLPDALAPLTVPAVSGRRGFWFRALRLFNTLPIADEMPTVDPAAIRVQRVYLAAADRFVESLRSSAPWMSKVLVVWEATLDALERRDRTWLSERLDPWIKYELFARRLADCGIEWNELSRRHAAAFELAVLNQHYHQLAALDSPFDLLDIAGLLRHRVVPLAVPGDEAVPYVPECGTRAAVRARFIRDRFLDTSPPSVDWNAAYDAAGNLIGALDDPFATSFSAY